MAREILQTGPSRNGDGLDFHHLMETMPEAAYSTDAEELITYFNRRAAAIWGREPQRHNPLDRY
jgi:PAS domain-containing protein